MRLEINTTFVNFVFNLFSINILYDIINLGISYKVKEIAFSRTALEIKSSVGAEPEKMYCYVRHKKSMNNKMVPHLIGYLKPNDDWIQRKPFKIE